MNIRERNEVAERFLAELGRGIPEDQRVMVGYADEATVQTNAEGKKMNAGWWPTPHREGKPIKHGDNCYVCISSSIKTENPKTGAMRFWRGDASFGRGLALMVDDIGTGKGSKGGLDLDHFNKILPPTATVQTSPGNYQLWYFFDVPCDSIQRFKAFLMGFVNAVLLDKGGDSTIRDASRYGRLPAGINNKRDKNGAFKYLVDGSPYRVELVQADYSRRYSMDRIATAFGFPIHIPVVRALTKEEKAQKNEAEWFDARWLDIAIKVFNKKGWGEGSGGEVRQNMSGKYRVRCPWGDEHSNGDPYGAYFRGPIRGAEYEHVFGCGHDSCRKEWKRTWSPFVDKMVMPVIYATLSQANKQFLDIDISDVRIYEGE